MSNIEVGKRLYKLRLNTGFNESQVANYLNVDEDTFHMIENGEKDLDYTLVSKLCALYNCSIEYLILGENDAPKPIKLNYSTKNIDLNVIATMNETRRYLNILYEIEE